MLNVILQNVVAPPSNTVIKHKRTSLLSNWFSLEFRMKTSAYVLMSSNFFNVNEKSVKSSPAKIALGKNLIVNVCGRKTELEREREWGKIKLNLIIC